MGRHPYKNSQDVRLDTFAMRVNAEERRMLVALAQRLQRSQGDVVRLLVREATRELEGLGLLQAAGPASTAQRREPQQEKPDDPA